MMPAVSQVRDHLETAKLKLCGPAEPQLLSCSNCLDFYFASLLLMVGGYAFLGKGFAYAGIPPLFPGEIMLFFGLITLVYPSASFAAFASLPSLFLLLMVGWVIIRTIPFFGFYRLDALRDSVVVTYGLFAFVIANLILAKPSRIDRAVSWAAKFFTMYGATIFVVYTVTKRFENLVPHWPVSDAPILSIRGGEAAVHIGAAAVFALLGMKRSSVWWIFTMILGFAAVSAQSRGGMLAVAIPFTLAATVTGKLKVPIGILLAALPIFFILYVSDVEVPLESTRRSVKVSQLLDNVTSVFVKTESSDSTLDDTKKWRLRWWEKIVDYTVHGDAFWTGRGFGLNLAEQDGFAGTDKSGPPLRSPHSVHMTMLARTGIPGLVLWALMHFSWACMMIRRVMHARLCGDTHWASLLLFVTCYALGILIDSSFDVAIEGPMVGIPFWLVFGAGIGLSLTYDALCLERATRISPHGIDR